ncbi:MAG: ABC transporter ATP-binding protein [Peptoniphilaceae bacterium]|uniref:ATP-binding cassette domain-containing protein n=1 Tax=Parvimonas sp. TaxID=1944660 RepID=UPI0025D42716|nr:ABC transporter ATP-binding protein [Parvimonas sp.]MCI5997107.1 ABC transporter ATP-binding protein/permease [Parvimonas sp.]MDD7764784.1 ABC transporter ATP-binding protein [Peptoniphilaceae bacterium]MDY3050882.1 ABC transporter ATP-binding protein [Parvimonas sp.]
MINFKNILKELLPIKIVCLCFSILKLSANMYLILLIQNLIDYIVKDSDKIFTYFKVEIFKYFFVLPLFLTFVFFSNYYHHKVSKKGELLIKNHLFKKLIFRKELLSVDSGLVSSQFLTDIKSVSKWYSVGGTTFIIQLIQFLVPFLIMMYYSIILSVFVPVLILICYFIQNKISKYIAEKTQKLQYNTANINQFIIQSLNSFKTILQLNKSKYFSDKFNSLQKTDIYDVDMKISFAYAFFVALYVALNNIIPFFILGFGLYLILVNMLTIGKLIAIYTLIAYMTEPIIVISDLLSQRKVSKNLVSNISYMFDYNVNKGKVNFLDKFKELQFDSKYFLYNENSDKRILENINFTIHRDDVVKINGMSGSGKTTLINLISRFLKSDTIRIKYNSVDINEIDIDLYYKNVIQVEQQPIMIEDTVYENIVLDDTYQDCDLDEVIDICCLREFVENKKLDFVLSEGAKNISGGEKQRINLARMLIRKPEILILDEPTASLNRKMAKDLVKNLKKFIEKYSITLIVISHNDDFDDIVNKQIDLS